MGHGAGQFAVMTNIQWLCPLDTDQTEIARYSQGIMPSMRKHFCLGLVDDGDDHDKEFECEKQILGMEPINIYNIGNSHLHCSILDMALSGPGVVILHDVSLFELALAYARTHPDFSLQDLIANEHDAQAVEDFNQMFGGSAYEWHGRSQKQYDNFVGAYPLFQSFISNARAVVVHSEYALKRVEKVYDGPVLKLELPYPVPSSGNAPRQHKEPCEIVFCGHAGPNRRLREFIQAWAEVSQPNFFHLSLFGAIDKADEIIALAEEHGVAELINVGGFVSETELNDALAASDLALNLRNPTMGETSASQLRHWSNALPTLVSDIGWYSELPHDVVIKVSPDREKQDIIAIMENFISGKHSYYEYGINGYEYLLQEHGVDQYVRRLAEYVAQIEKSRFVTSEVDERLVDFLASMCHDADDSRLFEHAIEMISETFSDTEQAETGT